MVLGNTSQCGPVSVLVSVFLLAIFFLLNSWARSPQPPPPPLRGSNCFSSQLDNDPSAPAAYPPLFFPPFGRCFPNFFLLRNMFWFLGALAPFSPPCAFLKTLSTPPTSTFPPPRFEDFVGGRQPPFFWPPVIPFLFFQPGFFPPPPIVSSDDSHVFFFFFLPTLLALVPPPPLILVPSVMGYFFWLPSFYSKDVAFRHSLVSAVQVFPCGPFLISPERAHCPFVAPPFLLYLGVTRPPPPRHPAGPFFLWI